MQIVIQNNLALAEYKVTRGKGTRSVSGSVASRITASNFSPYAIAQKKAACSSGFSESTAEKLARASPAKWDYFDAEW